VSNFIVGDEVMPPDAEKHTETPLMEGIDPACVFLPYRATKFEMLILEGPCF